MPFAPGRSTSKSKKMPVGPQSVVYPDHKHRRTDTTDMRMKQPTCGPRVHVCAVVYPDLRGVSGHRALAERDLSESLRILCRHDQGIPLLVPTERVYLFTDGIAWSAMENGQAQKIAPGLPLMTRMRWMEGDSAEGHCQIGGWVIVA